LAAGRLKTQGPSTSLRSGRDDRVISRVPPILQLKEQVMKTHRYSIVVVLLMACIYGMPAFGVSKEMVQLQTQVQGLQDQMTQMQTSFNERMGVMQHLMDQNTDSMNKVAASITAVQTSLEKLQTDNGGKVEQLSARSNHSMILLMN
jgi:hypothetical protein